MPFPPKKPPEDEDEDVGALSALMAESGTPEEGEEEPAEAAAPEKDPQALVAKLQTLLTELQASIS